MEESKVLKGVMINKDVVHQKMKRLVNFVLVQWLVFFIFIFKL